MKILLMLCGAFLTLIVNAANVQWDCFSTDTEGAYWGLDGLCIHYQSDMIQPAVMVHSARDARMVTLNGSTHNATLAFVGFWSQMAIGDVVSHSTMMAQKEYFAATAEYDDYYDSKQPQYEQRTDMTPKTIETTATSSVYLAVIVDLTGLENSEYENYYYGWVELKVDARGEVSLGRSALDLDGGPMIVGGTSAIPEPASAVLLLVGSGVLGLRRKRVKTLH